MTGKMKALFKNRRGKGATLKEVDIPKIKVDEVLIKVKAAAICGTDKHIYEWDQWSQSRIKPPMIFGHECAGEVIEVGDKVKKIKKGDCVSAETHIPDQTCKLCQMGLMHICKNMKILGVDVDGAFAEYVVIPEICAWKNDPKLPMAIAAIQEPFGNATYTVMSSDVKDKITVIMGDGPIACFAVGIAKAVGANPLIAVGKYPYRKKLLKKMGADIIIDSKKDDVLKQVLKLSQGYGADVVLEMAGSKEAVETGFAVLRKAGQFTAFGIPKEPFLFDYANNLVFKDLTLKGISGRLMFKTWEQLSDLLNKKLVDPKPVITHQIPFDNWQQGFNIVTARNREVGKVVFTFD